MITLSKEMHFQYVSSLDVKVQAQIKKAVTKELRDINEYTKGNMRTAMHSKVTDLENIIKIKYI